MKSDRLQGIIISGATTRSVAGSKKYKSKLFKAKFATRGIFRYRSYSVKAQQRYIEVSSDYAELIASDLLERMRSSRR